MSRWLLVAWLIALPVSAEVFTYIDAQGNRTFTDQPTHGNAKRVPLATSNRMAAHPTAAQPLLSANPPEEQPLFHYDMLRILVPEPDATIRSSAGEIIVSVTNEPGLQPGHRYRLLLDGQPTAEPGFSPVFPLSNIDRGTHNLSVEILDEQGRTVERTANQPFHMQRTSPRAKTPGQTLHPHRLRPTTGMPAQRQTGRRKKSVLAFVLTSFRFAHYIGAIGCTVPTSQPILVRKYPRKLAERHANELQTSVSGVKRFFSEPWFGFCIFPASALVSCARSAPEEVPMTISDALHRLLLDNLTTATILLDAELRLEYMNPAAEMLLAISGQRSHGQFISELFTESTEALNSLRQAVEQAHPFTKREAMLTALTGQTLTVDYAVTPILANGATLLLLEVHPRDRLLRITKEEAQLSKQETSKMLVRGLAHEIKNPLGGIRGAAQLLARELPEESLRDYTNVIIEEADRLRNLVDRMLGSNKLPSLAMCNVHEVLERVCHLVEAESQGCITLVRDYDPSIPDVLIDREQMIQAVLNIVRNAMQAISSQNELRLGRISLRTRAMRQFTIGHVRHRLVTKIEIIDNGPGIPVELQETIFFPMVSGRPDGTGLGLAITQNIISQHQGLIECDSHPGHTTFSIFLPLEQGATST